MATARAGTKAVRTRLVRARLVLTTVNLRTGHRKYVLKAIPARLAHRMSGVCLIPRRRRGRTRRGRILTRQAHRPTGRVLPRKSIRGVKGQVARDRNELWNGQRRSSPGHFSRRDCGMEALFFSASGLLRRVLNGKRRRSARDGGNSAPCSSRTGVRGRNLLCYNFCRLIRKKAG